MEVNCKRCKYCSYYYEEKNDLTVCCSRTDGKCPYNESEDK